MATTSPPPSAGSATVNYDERYRKGWAYGKSPSAFLVEAVRAYLPRQDRPLDVVSFGEGQGRHAVFLASLGHKCVGIDRSAVGNSKAWKLAEDHGIPMERISFVEADLCVYNPLAEGHRWDVIVAIHCNLAPAQRVRLHRAAMEMLRPGGIVIIECFAPGQASVVARGNGASTAVPRTSASGSGGDEARSSAVDSGCAGERVCVRPSWLRAGPVDASHLVSHSTLAAVDFAGLEVLVSREAECTLAEGRFHRGPAVLTQFVARRRTSPTPSIATSTMMPAVEAGRGQSEYRSAVDVVFAEATRSVDGDSRTAESLAADAAAEYAKCEQNGTDRLLFCASTLLRIGCAEATRAECCRYCWLPRNSCLCASISDSCAAMRAERQEPGSASARLSHVHWVVVSHPAEFLRGTSTAKIAAQALGGGCGSHCESHCEWLVYGCAAHERRMDELLSWPQVHVLFPRGNAAAMSVAEAIAKLHGTGAAGSRSIQGRRAPESAGEEKVPKSTGGEGQVAATDVNTAAMMPVVLVPDGSWECARSLVRELSLRAPQPLRFIELDSARVAEHTSPLIDALHSGAGRGRLSTLEACAHFLHEAGSPGEATVLLRALEPLVAHVQAENESMLAERQTDGRHAGHTQAFVSGWVDAVEDAARRLGSEDVPLGLRRCCVCGAALSTHLRMQRHLQGRRHCEAVVRAYLRQAGPAAASPNASAAAIAWREYSVASLVHAYIEPPDVALAHIAVAMQLGANGHGA
jgi:DTW domain-containing protein YfiP